MNIGSRFQNKPGAQKGLMIALLGVASILVILVAIDIFRKPAGPAPLAPETVNQNEQQPVDIGEIVDMSLEQRDKFRNDVPVDIVVPNVDTQLSEEQKKEIALPTVVVPAAPGSSSKFRNFSIRAENGAFTPTKVIANVGDTVHIDFTAVDGQYDIVFPSYNMSQNARQGETKILEFQANQEGSFTYYCSTCGGPDAGPIGNIIIVQ